MKKKLQKKSEVLREGYVQGLKKAQRIINEELYGGSNDDDVLRNIKYLELQLAKMRDLIEDAGASSDYVKAHDMMGLWSGFKRDSKILCKSLNALFGEHYKY